MKRYNLDTQWIAGTSVIPVSIEDKDGDYIAYEDYKKQMQVLKEYLEKLMEENDVQLKNNISSDAILYHDGAYDACVEVLQFIEENEMDK